MFVLYKMEENQSMCIQKSLTSIIKRKGSFLAKRATHILLVCVLHGDKRDQNVNVSPRVSGTTKHRLLVTWPG